MPLLHTPSDNPNKSNTVLIIGGGISGLALAHGLKKHDIPFHIYERDSGKDFRAQGYRIRIARDAVGSLEYLFDDTTWRHFELTCAETRLAPIAEIDAQTGRVDEPQVENAAPPPGAAKPYTVDRTLFREVMLRDLGDYVSYGKALTRFEESAEGSVTAFFEDGGSATGALLVGADGAHSRVRRQYLPDHAIVPTGGVCIYGKTELTPEVTASLEPAVLRGMGALKDRTRDKFSVTVMEPVIFPNRKEMAQRGFHCPPDYLYWVLSAQPSALDLDLDLTKTPPIPPSSAASLALHLSQTWHPSLQPIITHQVPHSTSLLPISSVPATFSQSSWPHGSRVTLIGDAVHVMGPTSGSGAIVALRDAQTLCEGLVEDGFGGLRETIGRYEVRMREYAGQTVRASWRSGEWIFAQERGREGHVGEVMIRNRQRKV